MQAIRTVQDLGLSLAPLLLKQPVGRILLQAIIRGLSLQYFPPLVHSNVGDILSLQGFPGDSEHSLTRRSVCEGALPRPLLIISLSAVSLLLNPYKNSQRRNLYVQCSTQSSQFVLRGRLRARR